MSKVSEIIKAAVQAMRTDNAIYNPLTSFGIGKDTAHAVSRAVPLLSYEKLRSIYRFTALARKAVDRPVKDVMSRRSRIDVDGRDVSNDPKWVAEARRLAFAANVTRAAQWSRAFGSARVVLDVDDGLSFEQPLGDYTRINQLLVFDGFQLVPDAVLVGGDVVVGPVDQYRSVLPGTLLSAMRESSPPAWKELLAGGKIHHSRLFTVVGNDLHPVDVQFDRPEGDSIIQTFWRELDRKSVV